MVQIPLIQAKKCKVSISCFLEDIDPIFKFFQDLMGRNSRICRHASFPTFSMLEIPRFTEIILFKLRVGLYGVFLSNSADAKSLIIVSGGHGQFH